MCSFVNTSVISCARKSNLWVLTGFSGLSCSSLLTIKLHSFLLPALSSTSLYADKIDLPSVVVFKKSRSLGF